MAEDENDKSKPPVTINHNHNLLIAILVIVPFMIFFGVVLLVFRDAVLLEKMTALLSGLVAAVVGYYFGQRPTQQLAEQVKETQAESEENKRDADEAEDIYYTLAEKFETLNNQLKEIKKTKDIGK